MSASDDLLQSFVEAVTMGTQPVEQPRPLTADSYVSPPAETSSPVSQHISFCSFCRSDMANQRIKLEEKLTADECFLFQVTQKNRENR